MKKAIIAVVVLTTLMGLVLTGCAVRADSEGASILPANSETKTPNSISVSAQGKVTAQPDVAYVTVGVISQNEDMQAAQDQNAQTMAAMSEALKGAGLSDEDIKTVQYNAYPIYDYTSSVSKITGYEVNNQVELTIKDIKRVGEYIDIAVKNGANSANSINFGILDQQAIYNDALKLAVEAAKAKADTLAAAGGVKIVGMLQMSENSTGGDVIQPFTAAADSVDKGGAATPISSGTLDIEASVSVVYEID